VDDLCFVCAESTLATRALCWQMDLHRVKRFHPLERVALVPDLTAFGAFFTNSELSYRVNTIK